MILHDDSLLFNEKKKLLFFQHTAANLLCDMCGKTFVFASALSKHRISHVDDRPEQCPHCEKAFKFKRALKEHMLTHVR